MPNAPHPLPGRRVAYIHSESLIRAADRLPSNEGRASLVHALTNALELLHDNSEPQPAGQPLRAAVVESVPATRDDLIRFHDPAFVDALLGIKNSTQPQTDSDSEPDAGPAPRARDFHLFAPNSRDDPACSPRKRQKLGHAGAHGLEDDCPEFFGMGEYVWEVAGASLTAARELREGRAEVAIAWTGGRHHGRRGEAAGFCYVQDIALAIQELRKPPPKTRPRSPPSSPSPATTPPDPSLAAPRPPPTRISRVLYLDIDLHHGDGVELAFASSPFILTLSVHLHAPLFFPASGALGATGPVPPSKAAFHALNAALHPGLSSENLIRVFENCVEPVVEAYGPDCVVVQCGCDGLAGDPCAEWALGLEGIGEVVRRVVGWGKRVLLLGGGGYDHPNAARCWAYLTSVALGRPLPLSTDIPPDLDEYEQFGPSFTLNVPGGNRVDDNTEARLAEVEVAFAGYAERLRQQYKPSPAPCS